MAATGELIKLEPEPRSEAELYKYWQNLVKECGKSTSELGGDSSRQSLGSTTWTNSNPALKQSLAFARMYSDLIHSGKYTERVMRLENSYKPAVDDMFKTRDISLEELQTRSSKEIEAAIGQLGHTHTEATISSLSSRHCQDMERLLNNWNMSIEALKDAQREEFCERLKEMHKDLCDGTSDHDTNSGQTSLDLSSQLADLSASSDKSAGTSISIEDLTQEASLPVQMEESFTINLGSQLKTAHNLRILASESLHLCDPSRNRAHSRCQMRTQTAMSLYSHNLSALVMLVDAHFESYYGIQHEFAQLCNSMNEFHFDSLAKQLKHIREHVLPSYAGRRSLETGDCYVTRHSNLENVHVVFHLVADDSLKTCEINSRHQIMASLRNILRVAHMYDIRTISIPLLLVDEMDEEILTVAWCLKRAEIVLKCVKGFLIEMASLSTGVEQGTIQFLVPKGISEELFANLAALIPEVFRLANTLNLRTM